MTTRVLTCALTLGMAGWLWTPAGRSETPPPVVAFPAVGESAPGVVAGESPIPTSWGLAERDPFRAGALTFQALAGYYSQTRVGPHGPPVDYAPIVLRVGCVLDTPQGDGELRGCWEALLEANYSAIVRQSGGSYIAGPVALLRYNFVQPTCVFVPYVQGGMGLTLNDGWRIQPSGDQPLLGEAFEFLLRADVGVRYMIHDCFSFDIEAGYQHISNAGLARHNGGVNNLGGMVGFTYYFGTN
jgi:lipid A 3-O-deacylase